MSLDELRKRIDELDSEILRCLNERAKCAMTIGDIKRANNAAYYVPERERAVYDKLQRENKGPLAEAAVKAIYREIISAVRALEKPVDVAFLGPRDTFSHKASLRIFGTHATYHPVAAVDDIFTEVERFRVDYGVVPVETSMGGSISDTLDRFLSSDVKIVNEIMLHIVENLLSNSPLEEISKVYSKAQPFIQCRNWLKANLPTAKLVETSSTAEAARVAAGEPGAAAIASDLAAETYNLNILVRGIEDASANFTRFFVIGRQLAKPTGNDKTSILCYIKDRPGALYDLLTPLREAKINLTRIESRPSRRKAWDYVFFIDMNGHCEDPDVKKALQELSHYCTELKVLGSFPGGDLVY
ncbi:MAG TPA: prephenate dehydratase [Candidatus Hydrogenedentes bacterium]|nr:prephenate dehydratase [Candidatus Hydrogenedentota bacterium]HQE82992.1 prephenate dehydratase [Candidatus Hydrogenedentota bacterium]HQH54027.1 prephenate dehydratase [Candidatus Hydrogenedentota bacterium]HQM49393.1 prephenate dehydratase [Candidatus Hydrogenedentota bacterium]